MLDSNNYKQIHTDVLFSVDWNLTEGKIVAADVWVIDRSYYVSGLGYNSSGEFL